MTDAAGAMDAPTPDTELEQKTTRNVRNILGVEVCVLNRRNAFGELAFAIENQEHRKYAFLNAHGANVAYGNAAFRNVLKSFLVVADGIGVDVGSWLLYGAPFPDNLNGTDFIPGLLSALEKPVHVALLGAKPGIADAAAVAFEKAYPKHRFTVVSHGYFDAEEESEVLKRLVQDRPDVLLVAMGNPHQEFWIAENCNQDHATLAIGVGALFDFVSGDVPRAPDVFIRYRIEWLYRLMLEPTRMWRRYVVGNPLFVARILKQKFFGLRNGRR